jgi:hypothetical protein
VGGITDIAGAYGDALDNGGEMPLSVAVKFTPLSRKELSTVHIINKKTG